MTGLLHRIAAWGIAWLLPAAIALAQCPMCKTAVEKSEEGREMASTLNAAILVLFSAPFIAAGIIGLLLWRAHRRRVKSRLAASDAGANI